MVAQTIADLIVALLPLVAVVVVTLIVLVVVVWALNMVTESAPKDKDG